MMKNLSLYTALVVMLTGVAHAGDVGLTSLFAFDEGQGAPANAVDAAPGGALFGNRADKLLPQYVPGVKGQALQFAGVSRTEGNWVDAGKTGLPDSSQGWKTGSVSLWVKVAEGSTNAAGIFGAMNSGSGSKSTFVITTSDDGAWRLFIRSRTNEAFTFGGDPGRWRDGKWHLIVITWDVDDNAGFYLDGVDVTSRMSLKDALASSNKLDKWDNTMRLGAVGRTDESNQKLGIQSTFDGCLDEVGIWNRRLTAAEVAAMHNLMRNPALNYGTADAALLLDVFARGNGAFARTSDGKMWRHVTGLTGAPGTIVDGTAIVLDANGGGVRMVD